ncbi:MAG TPA: hypothetical protein VJN72_05755 [Gaiellales bacterium]|nr:hypothetical protein [Gaiellales bacterium]
MGYSTLLFLHVTSAFTMVTAAGLFLAIALAQRSDRHSATALRLAPAAAVLWPIGSLLAIVFGVWLALHDSQYSLGDGWIIAAIVLWVIGGAIGGRLGAGYRKLTSGGATDPAALALNLALVITLLVILIDMIYKPGAS